MVRKFVGRGNKAPSARKMVWVPEPIKPGVMQLARVYRELEASGGRWLLTYPLILISELCNVLSAPKFGIGDYVVSEYWLSESQHRAFLDFDDVPEELRDQVRFCVDKGVVRGQIWVDSQIGLVAGWIYAVFFDAAPSFHQGSHLAWHNVPEEFLRLSVPESPLPPSC
jgi:hypothetical protein